MNIDDLKNDIPVHLARAAHAGTSFSPKQRGEQERTRYAELLAADHAALSTHASTDDKRATLEAEFARYREGYKARKIAYLQARSRCISMMIAGPSNFNVRRADKPTAAARKRLEELVAFRERALAAIRKALRPEDRPIMAGDEDAADRLREKIAAAEAWQATMKSANAAIRKHARAGRDAMISALVAVGLTDAKALEITAPGRFGGMGFARVELVNHNASLKRMRQRLARVEAARATPASEASGDGGIRLEDDPRANRVRLYFPGKPDPAIRTRLKRGGFRWAPSTGAWQAYRNSDALALAREIAGVALPAPPASPARAELPVAGDRVRRRERPSHVGTVVAAHGADASCATCIGQTAHVVVRWDDGPREYDEAPEDLAPFPPGDSSTLPCLRLEE